MYEIENAKPQIEEQNENPAPDNITAEEKPAEETPMVPLLALQKERQRRKQAQNDPASLKKFKIADKLMEKTGKNIDELINEIDGYGDSLVHSNEHIEEKDYGDELDSLCRNPVYADIHQNKDEVSAFAAKKNLSLKEAYNALYAERRINDIAKLIEHRVLNDLSKKQSRRIPSIPGGSAAPETPAVELSASELKIASAAGISAADYYNYKQRRI